MRRPLLLPLLLAASLVATSCGIFGEEQDPLEELEGFLEEALLEMDVFAYTEESGGREVAVRGQIEDFFRRQDSLVVDDVAVLERVILDDALAMRVLAPELVPALDSVPDPADERAINLLREKQWVVDPSGAPAISADPGLSEVGNDPLRDAANIFLYFRQAIQQAVGVGRFNPDSPFYRPALDPFPHPDRDAGERRFDLVRRPLPTRETGGPAPGTGHFRKMSFYVRDGKLVEVLEEIDIEGHEEFVRAKQTGRNEYLLRLLEDLLGGRGSEVIRPRTMSFQVVYQDEPPAIAVPDEVVTGNLQAIFGTSAEVQVRSGGYGFPLPQQPGLYEQD